MYRETLLFLKFFVGADVTPSEEHALVIFQKDEGLSVVPRRKIVEIDLTLYQSCTVKWTDGRKYTAELLFLGKLRSSLAWPYRLLFFCIESRTQYKAVWPRETSREVGSLAWP